MLLPGFETCDLNSGRTARLAGAAASHFLVTYNADIRCRERKGKGGNLWTAAGLREREERKVIRKSVYMYAHVCMCVCVCQLSAYTYNRPAGGKVVCLPGREYGNDISHEVSGTNIWRGSFGEEAGDRF